MSRVIYPKGRTVPGKKIEAIDDGIKYADEAIKIADKDDDKEDAYRYRAILYVEKEKILEKGERADEVLGNIKNALKEALYKGKGKERWFYPPFYL